MGRFLCRILCGGVVIAIASLPAFADVSIRVSLSAGGEVYTETVPDSVGYVVFTNIPVNVSRNPVVQVRVQGTRSRWWVHAGSHEGELKELGGSATAGIVTLNLYGKMGWRGAQHMDVLVRLKDDISVVQFDLSRVAEKDVVFEDDKRAMASRFGENPDSLQCYVEQGRRHKGVKADGLPEDRVIQSSDEELGTYRLMPYDTLNAIELAANQAAIAESHMIDVPNHKYSKLGMLTASQGGDTSFTLILHYEDGTATTNWFESDDWHHKSRSSNIPVLEKMDWAISTDGAVEDSNHFQIYEFIFTDVDRSRNLDMITIGNTPHRWPDGEVRFAAVFAVNGRAEDLAQ